jgi:secreted trypsin-like serine protease
MKKGGPLTYPISGVYYIFGIVSYGISCDGKGEGYYTSIPHFIDWLAAQLSLLYTVTSTITTTTTTTVAPILGLPKQLQNSGVPPVKPVWQTFPLAPRGRIVGGEEAVAFSWPWQVGLFELSNNSLGTNFCGGSLIYENYVLTSAQCVASRFENTTVVVVGIHSIADVSTVNANQIFRISLIIIHENYNNSNGNISNDIALLLLTNNVTISNTVNTIRLPVGYSLETILAKRVVITGW